MASNSPPLKPSDQRSKSCDTACSSNSSCFFQRRKPTNPLANPLRNAPRGTANSVRQRVLSAKLLRLKSVQNQLNDANFHLAEVIRENQALKTLQKRQDKALSKYEGANAELPRLIQSHEEEIRFLTEKNKLLRRNIKELNEQLKHKSDELQSLQEQLRHYEKLDRDKNLLEREKLVEELEDIKTKLHKADGEIVILNRKLSLETKTSKQRLNAELLKHKQCQKELAQALVEISKLRKIVETKDKSSANGRKRFSTLPQRQSTSLISLNGTKPTLSEVVRNFSNNRTPVTEVKLESLTQTKDDAVQVIKPYKGILKCPTENVRARLSAGSRGDTDYLPSVDKLSLSGSETPEEKDVQETRNDLHRSKSEVYDSNKDESRPSSSQQLQKIEATLHNTIQKVEDNKNGDEFSKHMGDYCLQAIDSVKNYTEVIETHRESLAYAKEDTHKIMQTVKEADNIEKRLKREVKLLNVKSAELSADNFDFVTQILQEEVEFQTKYQDPDKGGKKEPKVGQSDKKKLLAALRAIDNGDSVDSFESGSQKKNLMKELFGDISN